MYFPNTEYAREWMLRGMVGRSIQTIGITSGCFDILHPLHVQYLEKCKARCEILLVGVDSDRLVEEHKHKVPVYSEHDRAYMVSALNCVHAAFVMDDMSDLAEIMSECSMIYRKDKDVTVELYKNSLQYYGDPVLRISGVDTIHIPDVYPINSTTELVKYIQQDYQKL